MLLCSELHNWKTFEVDDELKVWSMWKQVDLNNKYLQIYFIISN